MFAGPPEQFGARRHGDAAADCALVEGLSEAFGCLEAGGICLGAPSCCGAGPVWCVLPHSAPPGLGGGGRQHAIRGVARRRAHRPSHRRAATRQSPSRRRAAARQDDGSSKGPVGHYPAEGRYARLHPAARRRTVTSAGLHTLYSRV